MVRHVKNGMDPVSTQARIRATELTRWVREALPDEYGTRRAVSTEWYGASARTRIRTTEADRISALIHVAFPYASMRCTPTSVTIDWTVRDGVVTQAP